MFVTDKFSEAMELVPIVLKEGTAIPVTGRGDPQGCETSRLAHCLDNRLKDVGKIVRPTRRPPFSLREDFWYTFLLDAESHAASGS
jgi:hypothetical protein